MIALKRRRDVIAAVEAGGEDNRILERHRSALRDVLHHRMGGIAEKRHTAFCPVLHWPAMADHVAAESGRNLQQALDRGVMRGE